MKKILAALVLLPAAAVGGLLLTHLPQTLPTGGGAAIATPAARPPPSMTLSVLHAGKMLSQAAFAYRGGSFTEPRVFGMAGILVDHPKGALLFDAGFGRDVDAHVQTTPWLMRATSKYEKEMPVADRLRAGGFDLARLKGVVLTHAHWDHVSGLADLPGVPVWVTREELDFIGSGDPGAALAASFGELPYHVYGFPHGPYLGFEASYDVFGDGSVVLVHAPGHTPGSVIAFIALASGKRYALIGDLVWQKEGVEIPAERPWMSRRLVDWDAERVRGWIVQMHRIARAVPILTVVPAHDRRVLETLPRFVGNMEKDT